MYTINIEGYEAQGNSAGPKYLGCCEGKTFEEASKNLLILLKYDMKYYNEEKNTYRGCKLFQ
jgi:hypothetical protein